MTFSIDNPEGGCNNPPLRKICLGKTLRRTRVNRIRSCGLDNTGVEYYVGILHTSYGHVA